MNKKRYYRHRYGLSTIMVVLIVLFPVFVIGEVNRNQSDSTTYLSPNTTTVCNKDSKLSSSIRSLKLLPSKIDASDVLHGSTEPVSKSVTALNDQCHTEKKKKITKHCPLSMDSKNTGNCDMGQCFKIKYTTVESITKRWSLKHKICPKFQMVHVNCGVKSTTNCCSLAVPTNGKHIEPITAVRGPLCEPAATCTEAPSSHTKTPKYSSSSSTGTSTSSRSSSTGTRTTSSRSISSSSSSSSSSSNSAFSCPDDSGMVATGHTDTGDESASAESDGADDEFPQPPSTAVDRSVAIQDEEMTSAYEEKVENDDPEVSDEAAASEAGTENYPDVGKPVTWRVTVSLTRRVTVKETAHPRFSIVSPISKRRSYECRKSRTSEFHRMYDDDDDDNGIGKDNGVRHDGRLATG